MAATPGAAGAGRQLVISPASGAAGWAGSAISRADTRRTRGAAPAGAGGAVRASGAPARVALQAAGAVSWRVTAMRVAYFRRASRSSMKFTALLSGGSGRGRGRT